MNIRDLEYFHKLAELGSFTMVAGFFGVSQPTITYAVKRLEEVYACDLVIKDRSHRSVVLTSEGKILDNHIKTVLEELMIAQKSIARSCQHEVRVGLPPMIRSHILSAIIDKGEALDFMAHFNLSDVKGSRYLLQQLLRW